MNTPSIDYDSVALLKRSRDTVKARAGKYARVARKIVEDGQWPGFGPEDKDSLVKAQESRKEKKLRIAQKIGELKSTVSELALDAVLDDDFELTDNTISLMEEELLCETELSDVEIQAYKTAQMLEEGPTTTGTISVLGMTYTYTPED